MFYATYIVNEERTLSDIYLGSLVFFWSTELKGSIIDYDHDVFFHSNADLNGIFSTFYTIYRYLSKPTDIIV